MKAVEWTDEEVEFLRSNFPVRSNAELARDLNRTQRSIIGKATRMGLAKTPEHLRKIGSENVTRRRDRDAAAPGSPPRDPEGLAGERE